MKIIYNGSILMIFLGICFTSAGHAAESSLRFSMIQDEIKVMDVAKLGLKINMEQYDLFAKDNVVYVISKNVLLDNKDVDCGEMLSTYYTHGASSDSSSDIFQYTIKFNKNLGIKLENPNINNAVKKLAIIFEGMLIASITINDSIATTNILINGLSYNDARQLDFALHKVCALASSVSFRLVKPDDEVLSRKSQPDTGPNKKEYERLSLESREYNVSKKAELDYGGFKDARMLLAVQAPFTENNVEEMKPEDIPWRFIEEEEAARNVHAFKVRINLNQNGQDILKKLSDNNAGQELATIFEGRLLYVERIPEKSTSQFVLVNGLTYNEAKRLADAVNVSP